jgi:hypothetical protein
MAAPAGPRIQATGMPLRRTSAVRICGGRKQTGRPKIERPEIERPASKTEAAALTRQTAD